jgi:hypothetical protein
MCKVSIGCAACYHKGVEDTAARVIKKKEWTATDEMSPAAKTPLIAAGDSILVFAAQASHSLLPVRGDGQYNFNLISTISAELCPAF